jgi:hypothetical protein
MMVLLCEAAAFNSLLTGTKLHAYVHAQRPILVYP